MVATSIADTLRYFVDSNIIGYIVQGHDLGVAYLDLMERLLDLAVTVTTPGGYTITSEPHPNAVRQVNRLQT